MSEKVLPGGPCEKVQGKFKVGALTYSLQRQDEAIRDGHGEIQPDPVRLGRFMETSPTGVGVRKFRESSRWALQRTACSVKTKQTEMQVARFKQSESDGEGSWKLLPPGSV